LNMIALNLYQPENGAYPTSFDDTSAVWSNCLDSTNATETLTGRTLSATCASLAKKGLVTTYNEPRRRGEPRQDTITMTADGYAAWHDAYPIDTTLEGRNAPAPEEHVVILTISSTSDAARVTAAIATLIDKALVMGKNVYDIDRVHISTPDALHSIVLDKE
jgi:hypothetical protein